MSHRFDTPLISGAHLFGSGGLGVLGSLIPATGDNGAGYTYNDLSLPTDNAKEICGRITTWPSSGTLTAYEDTSFEFSGAPDGSYSFAYQLYVDGVATGAPTAVSLLLGSVPVEIAASLGTATASGFSATVAANTSILTALGVANASGYPAGLSESATVVAALGVAIASGISAGISAGSETVIVCSVGNAAAAGYSALINAGFTITANLGTASALGYTASIDGTTFTGSISDVDIARIVQAVLAALNATTIPVDVQKMNSADVIGDGSAGNKWRGNV